MSRFYGGLYEIAQSKIAASPGRRAHRHSYSEIIRYFGEKDPTSRRVMEEILAKEEEHAEDMRTLIERIGKDAQQAERL